MEFRITYRGPLYTNAKVNHKHEVRRSFHPQLAELWQELPEEVRIVYLNPVTAVGGIPLIHTVGDFQFVPLVHSRVHLICHLDILFLRREAPGALVTGGDIDNRVKTLFDALRIPKKLSELPPGATPQAGETPYFFCLLEDDALVTRLGVTTDRLLDPGRSEDVSLVLHVTVKASKRTWDNIGLAF